MTGGIRELRGSSQPSHRYITLSARLGSVVTLQVSVSGVVVPAYRICIGAETETEGVGTVRAETLVIKGTAM